jgi:hypothetical protein
VIVSAIPPDWNTFPQPHCLWKKAKPFSFLGLPALKYICSGKNHGFTNAALRGSMYKSLKGLKCLRAKTSVYYFKTFACGQPSVRAKSVVLFARPQ